VADLVKALVSLVLLLPATSRIPRDLFLHFTLIDTMQEIIKPTRNQCLINARLRVCAKSEFIFAQTRSGHDACPAIPCALVSSVRSVLVIAQTDHIQSTFSIAG
jgi:hypothetical protein